MFDHARKAGYEIRSNSIGIVGVVVVRVAVTVHIAEIVAVVVIRRTDPPVHRRTVGPYPTGRFYRNAPIKISVSCFV